MNHIGMVSGLATAFWYDIRSSQLLRADKKSGLAMELHIGTANTLSLWDGDFQLLFNLFPPSSSWLAFHSRPRRELLVSHYQYLLCLLYLRVLILLKKGLFAQANWCKSPSIPAKPYENCS